MKQIYLSMLINAQLVKQNPVFYATRSFVTVLTRNGHWSLLEPEKSALYHSILLQYFVHFNIVNQTMRSSSKGCLFLRFSENPWMHFSLLPCLPCRPCVYLISPYL